MPHPPSPPEDEAPLFSALGRRTTSHLAGERAALSSRGRRAKIRQLLAHHGPLALFELAQLMEVHDHQISGRITDMKRDGEIEPTGHRKRKPETGCEAEVYKLSRAF